MTILVAIRDLVNGGVHIGGDTAVVYGGRRDEFGPKWITAGRWHIGVAGSMRAVSSFLLQRELLASADNLQLLAVRMRDCLKLDGFSPCKDEDGYGPSYRVEFLVTDGDVIAEISGSFCVSTFPDWHVCGSGAELAKGFLHCANLDGWPPQQMLTGAIECAMAHREDCAGEVWTDLVLPLDNEARAAGLVRAR